MIISFKYQRAGKSLDQSFEKHLVKKTAKAIFAVLKNEREVGRAG
jgi:hypothetical protein